MGRNLGKERNCGGRGGRLGRVVLVSDCVELVEKAAGGAGFPRGASWCGCLGEAGGEKVRAFVPDPLPPEPPLDLSGGRQRLLEKATLALGRLDSVCMLLPDPQLFLYSYVRREAVLSSQIEGTQSSLNDLLLFEMEEAPGVPFDDVQEVSNYNLRNLARSHPKFG